jgi:hypothetical protein
MDFKPNSSISQAVLYVRTELFEHGLFPPPPKLSFLNLMSLFSTIPRTKDHKITLSDFAKAIEKHIPSMSTKDADVYFLFFKIMIEDNLEFVDDCPTVSPFSKMNQLSSNRSLPTNSTVTGGSGITVDARGLAVFCFLQLFGCAVRQHGFPTDGKKSNNLSLSNQFNESIKGSGNLNYNFSPLNSPRSKTTRLFYFANEQQQILFYVKQNIKTIIKLLLNNFNNDEDICLTAGDMNLFKFLFRRNEGLPSDLDYSDIGALITKGVGGKLSLNNVADWLQNNISIAESCN